MHQETKKKEKRQESEMRISLINKQSTHVHTPCPGSIPCHVLIWAQLEACSCWDQGGLFRFPGYMCVHNLSVKLLINKEIK